MALINARDEPTKNRGGKSPPSEAGVSKVADPQTSLRRQGEARKAAREHYGFQCCIICGLQMPAALTVAHLDHQPGNNDPDNLAWLCNTHHWMFDCNLYPIEAVKLLRAHWQKTKGIPSHAGRMKQAGPKSAATRKRSTSARKAWATRKANLEPVDSDKRDSN